MIAATIQCMKGLGDNIFARPFIRAEANRRPVWLRTPWPELYEDLPVKFAQCDTKLRTQAKNVRRQPLNRWSSPLTGHTIPIQYGHASLTRGNISQAIERCLPLRNAPYVFDLPDMGKSPVESSKPIAVIRPVTARKEWYNTARNPRPEYIAQIAAHLMATHHVVAVGDLQIGQEWLVGEEPPYHEPFLTGELPVRQLLALIRDADVVVGGVGWIVPASIALKTKCFVVLGGQAQHNAPAVITDPRMDLTKIDFATPREYCKCSNMTHDCRKLIPDLPAQWNRFATRHGFRAICHG